MARISPEELQTQAERKVGIEDPEKALFQHNLHAIVSSINAEARLTERGVAETHGELLSALEHRLETLRWTRDFPEILDEPIEAPIFLTGLPRSGTTFLLNLFHQNGSLRLIRSWETFNPCPPPHYAPNTVPGRVAAAEQWAENFRELVPEFDATHIHDAEGPEECHNFLTQTFAQAGFFNYLNVPSYFEYLLAKSDLSDTYQVHKRQLQLLQWRGPKTRWALKYPNHLLAMNSILRVYPDARFVVTHRDPVQTLASICKLTHSYRRGRSADVDAKEVGRQMRHFVRRHIDRLMAFCTSETGKKTAVHVDYYQLVHSPGSVLDDIFPELSLTMSDKLYRRIEQWHAQNPKGKRGINSYSLDQFGLEANEIAKEYRFYTDYFAIPREIDAQ